MIALRCYELLDAERPKCIGFDSLQPLDIALYCTTAVLLYCSYLLYVDVVLCLSLELFPLLFIDIALRYNQVI